MGHPARAGTQAHVQAFFEDLQGGDSLDNLCQCSATFITQQYFQMVRGQKEPSAFHFLLISTFSCLYNDRYPFNKNTEILVYTGTLVHLDIFIKFEQKKKEISHLGEGAVLALFTVWGNISRIK